MTGVDGDGVRFARDGDRLRVVERSELWELEPFDRVSRTCA